MVRSNSPVGGDGRPLQGNNQHQNQDPQGWNDPGLSSYQPNAQGQQDPRYAAQQPAQPQGQAPDPYAQGQAAQGQVAQPTSQQYTPQYETYAPQTQPPAAGQNVPQQQAGGYNQQAYQQHDPHTGSPTTQPPAQYGADAYAQPTVGTDYASVNPLNQGQPDQWAADSAQTQGAQGYDMGSYGQPAAEWGQADAYGQQQFGEAGDPNLQAYAGQNAGGYQGEQAYGQAEGEDDIYEGYEDAPKSSRMLLIVGTLVAAIAIGGGLTFAYQTVLGPTAKKGAGLPPIVKGDDNPSKTKPTDPGGRKFAHADSKVLGRLGSTGARSGSAKPSTTAADGSRKVPTLVIGRDGSIQTVEPVDEPAPSAKKKAAGAAGKSDDINVPGLMVVDTFAAAGEAPPKPRQPPPQEPLITPSGAAATASPAAAKAPAKSKVVAPKKITAPPAAKKPAVEKKVAAVAPTPAPQAPSGPAWQTTGAGYVAVLASVPVSSSSRMNALKQFADIQQKYGSVLSGKTPDVREANLGDKGKYHRLLVGPPASREQANGLCKALKGAGYSSCWITAY